MITTDDFDGAMAGGRHLSTTVETMDEAEAIEQAVRETDGFAGCLIDDRGGEGVYVEVGVMNLDEVFHEADHVLIGAVEGLVCPTCDHEFVGGVAAHRETDALYACCARCRDGFALDDMAVPMDGLHIEDDRYEVGTDDESGTEAE